MESRQGFNFIRLHFNADGNLDQPSELDELKQQSGSTNATDAILIAHGFRNDENDATGLYDRFLTSFRDQLNAGTVAGLAKRNYIVGGVYWPSKPFQESFAGSSVQSLDDDLSQKEQLRAQIADLKQTMTLPSQKATLDHAAALLNQVEASTAAQDQFVSLVLSILDGSESDPTEGLERVRSIDGSALLDKLKLPIIVSTGKSGGEGGTESISSAAGDSSGTALGLASVFGSVCGRIGQFLNLTTWYVMKNRAGVVGAAGVAQAVRDLQASRAGVRIHLVGHSLGGRLMAGCSKSLAQTGTKVSSLTLLEAAFSHYGFSPNNGSGLAGFFRSVIDQQVVKGPLIATYSAQDTVVGKVYAVASRLASDSVQDIGDAGDPYGGIGRNGAQKTPEAILSPLLGPTGTFQFQLAKINCLDGSGGLIKDHSDVTNPAVVHAFASAVAMT